MQLTSRPLAPGELDHEFVWLAVSIGSLALAITWFKVGLPWPICVFHDLTGLPCVTCGATRATIEFLHGHFLAALKWNPLVFATLCGIVVFNVYAAVTLATRLPRLRLIQFTSSEKKIARIILIAAVVSNWIYLLSHSSRY